MRAQEVLSNNIANVQNDGFQRDRVAFRRVLADLASALPEQGLVAARDRTPGSVQTTGNPLDFAIEGAGYFVVQRPDGRELMTRTGAFALGTDGTLQTLDGNRVLGDGGPISLPPGTVTAGADGTLFVDGQAVGALRIVDADPSDVERAGSNTLGLVEGAGFRERPAATRVVHRSLEGSNVEAVTEMVDMMRLVREFEANVKAMDIQGETLKRLIEQYTRG
jgi:flagellar basal-body rod protein FlgF